MGPGQYPGGDRGTMPLEIFFSLSLQNWRKLAHRKNEILVLFSATSAVDMFNIHGIKNSSFVYVKHGFLYISTKEQFERNKYLLFNKSKAPPFLKKYVYLYISTKKEISKKIKRVCNSYWV